MPCGVLAPLPKGQGTITTNIGIFLMNYDNPNSEFYSHYLQGVQHRFLGMPINCASRKLHALKAYQLGYTRG